MEDRLERLEGLVALQDRTIEELNDALVAQQRQIDDLGRLVERIALKLRQVAENANDGGDYDVPPPHYGG